jgi:hypothetical protein
VTSGGAVISSGGITVSGGGLVVSSSAPPLIFSSRGEFELLFFHRTFNV